MESRAEFSCALPIEEKIGKNAGEGISVTNALTCFRQFKHAGFDEAPCYRFHPGGKLGGGCDTQGLAEDPFGGGEKNIGKVIDVIGIANRVRAEDYSAFVHPGSEAETADHILVGDKVREGNTAGLEGPEVEARGRSFPRRDITDQDGFLALESGPGDRRSGKRDAHLVGDHTGGVQDRDAGAVGFLGADRSRVREGEREAWIAHKDAARCQSFDLHRPSHETFELSAKFDVEDVQSLPQSFHQELGLPEIAGLQAEDIIGRPGNAIGAELRDGKDRKDLRPGTDPGESKRVIAGVVMSLGPLKIRAGREDQFRFDVGHTQTRSRRGGIFDEDLHAEELVQKPDLARYHHEAGERRDAELQILFSTRVDKLNVDRLDLDIEVGGFKGGRKLGPEGEFVIDAICFSESGLQFRPGNGLGLLAKGGRDHREADRNGLAVHHKPHFELDRAEVALVDHDSAFPNLGR